MPILKIKPRPNLKRIPSINSGISSTKTNLPVKDENSGPSLSVHSDITIKADTEIHVNGIDKLPVSKLPTQDVSCGDVIETSEASSLVKTSEGGLPVSDAKNNHGNLKVTTTNQDAIKNNLVKHNYFQEHVQSKNVENLKFNQMLILGQRKFKPKTSVSCRQSTILDCDTIGHKTKNEQKTNNLNFNKSFDNIFTGINIRCMPSSEIMNLKPEIDQLSIMYRDKYKDIQKKLTSISSEKGSEFEVLTNKQNDTKRQTTHTVKLYLDCWPKEWTETGDKMICESSKSNELGKNVSVCLLKNNFINESNKVSANNHNIGLDCISSRSEGFTDLHKFENKLLSKQKYPKEVMKLSSKPVPKVVGDKKLSDSSKEAVCLRFQKPKVKPSSYRTTCQEMKQNYLNKFGSGPPDVGKLRMRDLIFYNPSSNPMSKDSDEKILTTSETKLDKMDDGNEEDVDDVSSVPQLKVGPDGQIIIDPTSLPTKPKKIHKVEELLENYDNKLSGKTYKSAPAESRRNWSHDETIKFYKALHTIGADFSLMSTLFPNRTRKNLKYKFKKEEKVNAHLIDKVLSNPANFNIKVLEKELERDKKKTCTNGNSKPNVGKKLKNKEGKGTRFSFIEQSKPSLPAWRRPNLALHTIPYEALYEDSMNLLKACSRITGVRNKMKESYPRRVNRGDDPNGKKIVNELGAQKTFNQIKAFLEKKTLDGSREGGSLVLQNTSSGEQIIKSCSNVSEVEKDPKEIFKVLDQTETQLSQKDSGRSFNQVEIVNKTIEKTPTKKKIKRRIVSCKNITKDSPNHVRNLQTIVADGIVEDDVECLDVMPADKKNQIVINTNIVYDSINILRSVSYDTKNLNSPIDVNVTIDHQPNSKSNKKIE